MLLLMNEVKVNEDYPDTNFQLPSLTIVNIKNSSVHKFKDRKFS